MTTPGETDQAGGTTPPAQPRYGDLPRGGPATGSDEKPTTPPTEEYGEKPTPPAGEYGEKPTPPAGEYGEKPTPPAGEYGEKPTPPPTPPAGEYGEKPTPPPTPPAGEYGEKPTPPPAGEYGEKPTPPTGGYGEKPTPPPTPPAGGYGEKPTPPPAGEYGDKPPNGGFGPVDESRGAGAPTPTEASGGTSEKRGHPCPPSMTCDTGSIDDLQCEAEGVKAESEALAKVAEDLKKRRTAFETTRGTYATAREEAVTARDRLEKKLDCLERAFDDPKLAALNTDEKECLDRALGQVVDCLDKCPGAQGCCVCQNCGFEGQRWRVGQIDDLRSRVEKVEKCFDDVLVKEPDALKERVTEVTKLVGELEAELKDLVPTDRRKRLYARLQKARYLIKVIWGQFKDVNEFQDCLCRGFTCSLKGRKILAQLAGDQAYLKCRELSRIKQCDWLKANIEEETLATALVLCPPHDPATKTAPTP